MIQLRMCAELCIPNAWKKRKATEFGGETEVKEEVRKSILK
jgi:hypothetical protein